MLSKYSSSYFSNNVWPSFASRLKNEASVRCYESAANEMMNLLGKDILDMDENDADKYYNYLSDEENKGRIKGITKAVKIRWMDSLFLFLYENKDVFGINTNPYFKKYLGSLEKVSPVAKMVPLENIDKLFQAAKDDIMDYCILMMLFRAGFTTTEVSDMRPEDLAAYENGVYAMAGGYPRLIPEDAAEVLETYFEKRRDSEYLFSNRRGERLSRMYYTRMLKKYTDIAGIESCTCRSIRNTCGALMFSYDVNKKAVAKQLGITTKHIRRYDNKYYKDKELLEVSNLVKIKVSQPE